MSAWSLPSPTPAAVAAVTSSASPTACPGHTSVACSQPVPLTARASPCLAVRCTGCSTGRGVAHLRGQREEADPDPHERRPPA
jgi:hypothetical protein